MMTVILSLTGPIEHGQEERQAIEVGTGGVSPVGQEPPSTSLVSASIRYEAVASLPIAKGGNRARAT